jgi:hypothetical protein
MDREIESLQLRLSLLEGIALRAWVSTIAATDAQHNRETAKKLAESKIDELASDIHNGIAGRSAGPGALDDFRTHVESLKSLLPILR